MIQIKAEPSWVVAEHVGASVARVSASRWSVYVNGELVMFAGVARESMLGEAELWIHPLPSIRMHMFEVGRALRGMLAWVRSQYPKVSARVRDCDARIAEFSGMAFVGYRGPWRKYE